MPDQVLLIRHASSSGQSPNAPLTQAGLTQAEALANDLKGFEISQIRCSPYLRARQTITPFSAMSGLDITIDDDLAERVLSPTPKDDWLEQVKLSFDNLEHALPGGESLRQTADRAMRALFRAKSAAALVSHGNLIAAALNRIDPRFGFDQWRQLANPETIAVTRQQGRAVGFELLG